MKKLIILLSASALVFSCKKDKTNSFTQTDVSGTTVLKGNLSKNIITPNGSGSWTNGTRIPAPGVNVSVKVNKSSLYPNSTAQGADVYSATSDKDGNYSISVKSNATGVIAAITIDGFTGTLDTVVNGVTKTGFYSVYNGFSTNRTLLMGQNVQQDFTFNASPVITNPNTNLKIGKATITGSVGVTMIKEVASGTLITLTTTVMPLAGQTVYLNFSNDPDMQTQKIYQTTTDANGYYTFDNVKTVPQGQAGFPQNGVIYINDYASTRDTLKANNTIKTGRAGVYTQQNLNVFNVFNNTIRNANYLTFNNFIAN
jgi:hypothetical protein